jgi:competence protein ComGC
MKKIFIASLLILSIFVLFNCSKKSKAKSVSSVNTRNEYANNLKSQIDEWNLQLDKMDADAKKLKGEAKVKVNKELATIRIQREELKKNLEKIQNSSDNGWDDLKKGAEEAKDKINQAFSKAKAEFK